MKQVKIRMPRELADQVDARADELGFASRAEYFRYLARQDLQVGMSDDS